jgi:hypothetical protein
MTNKKAKKIYQNWKSDIATEKQIRNFISYLTKAKKIVREIDGYTFVKFLKIDPEIIAFESGIDDIHEILGSEQEEEILQTLHLLTKKACDNYPVAVDIEDFALIGGWEKLFAILCAQMNALPFSRSYSDKILVAAYKWQK